MVQNNQSKGLAVGLNIFLFLFFGIFFLAFTEMGFNSEDSSNFVIFFIVFIGAFIPIIACISAQKRKKEAMIAKVNIQNPEPIYQPQVPIFQEKKTSTRTQKSYCSYCSYCGENVTTNSIFCHQCGSKL